MSLKTTSSKAWDPWLNILLPVRLRTHHSLLDFVTLSLNKMMVIFMKLFSGRGERQKNEGSMRVSGLDANYKFPDGKTQLTCSMQFQNVRGTGTWQR